MIMLTAKEVTLFYETLLANSWMEEQVRVDLRLSRRNILALSKLIEIGLTEEIRAADSLLAATTRDVDVLGVIPADLRKKANLTEMYEKLVALVAK
jgi:hypothetical protein